jgi:hypothetical protein
MVSGIFKNILGNKKKETKPRDFEWEKFQKSAREQFIKLKKKGLSIPVVTL